MDERFLSRRALLRRSAEAGVAALLGATACGRSEPKALSCSDTSALPPLDAQVRVALAYVDVSLEPGKACAGCQQFTPGPADACGSCKVLKGPINPTGYCKSFAAKPPPG
jgi:hypothetical protein